MQSRHRRVLGELNLSVEAMLMPSMVDNNEEQMSQEVQDASTEELLPSVGPADDLSRVGCDMDSGFSGSSSASYRCVDEECSLTCLFVAMALINRGEILSCNLGKALRKFYIVNFIASSSLALPSY